MTGFIYVDKSPDGQYFVEGLPFRFGSLREALKCADEVKRAEGGIVANRASAVKRSHNQMSSYDRDGNYRVDQ